MEYIVDAIAGQDAEAAAAMIEVIHNGLRRHEGSVPGSVPATSTVTKPGEES